MNFQKESVEVVEISVDKIKSSRFQTRDFNSLISQRKIKELSSNIAKNGLVQDVIVRPVGDSKYELIAGERRLRASILAGKKTISAKVIEEEDDSRIQIMGFIENVHRKDLTPIEQAEAIFNIFVGFGMVESDSGDCSGIAAIPIQELIEEIGKIHHKLERNIPLSTEEDKLRGVCSDIGLSPIAIKKSLLLILLPLKAREMAKEQATGKETLAKIATVENEDDQVKLIDKIGKQEMPRDEASELIKTVKTIDKKVVSREKNERLKKRVLDDEVTPQKATEIAETIPEVSDDVADRMIRSPDKITPEIAKEVEKLGDEKTKTSTMDRVITDKLTTREVKEFIDDVEKKRVNPYNTKSPNAYRKSLEMKAFIMETIDTIKDLMDEIYGFDALEDDHRKDVKYSLESLMIKIEAMVELCE